MAKREKLEDKAKALQTQCLQGFESAEVAGLEPAAFWSRSTEAEET